MDWHCKLKPIVNDEEAPTSSADSSDTSDACNNPKFQDDFQSQTKLIKNKADSIRLRWYSTVELNAKFFWIATIHLRSTLQKSEFWNYCKKMLTQKKYFVLCDSKLNPINDNDEASDRALVADWVNGFSKETQHSSTMWHLNWKCENRGFDAPFRSANN